MWRNLLQRWKIGRWRQKYSIKKKEALFRFLYQDINGFLLSKEARQKQDALELVYGEIAFFPFVALLSLCHPNKDTVFYDLGSGTGKAVIACSLVYPIQKAVGVEILPNLHTSAEKVRKKMENFSLSAGKTVLSFIQQDILSTNLQDATLVFVNATAFFGNYWQLLSQYLEQLPAEAQVITTSKPLASSFFVMQKESLVKMSWGIVKVFIQKRIIR